MGGSCARAVELGLPAICFTEHADFTPWANESRHLVPRGTRVPDNPSKSGDLDIAGYWESIDRCRHEFPQLSIESGIELGEAHLFPDRAAAMLDYRTHDRVLGSVHCIDIGGTLIDVSGRGVLDVENAPEVLRRYLQATLDLVESDAPFSILTHLDYPKRYWPHEQLEFDERHYEAEYRAVLRALSDSGRVLEINSSRAMGPPRSPCPSGVVLRWWREVGGEAVSFGSDAHSPEHIGAGLAEAADLAEAAGFRPGSDPFDLWGRA